MFPAHSHRCLEQPLSEVRRLGVVVGAVLATCIAALGLTGCTGLGAKTGPWFEDVTPSSGIDFRHQSGHQDRFYMPEIMSGGGALFDMDGDGDLDAYLVQSGDVRLPPEKQPANQLYRNIGGGRFENITAGSGAEAFGYGMGVATGDYDNDGDADLYVTNVGPDRLLRNDGDGHFTDVTEAAGIHAPGWGASATFWDYDRDGHLDIFVAQYLIWSMEGEPSCKTSVGLPDYCSPQSFAAQAPAVLLHNNGDGSFSDQTEKAGMTTFGTGLGVVSGDFDGDQWPDMFVANDGMPNRLWLNQHDGTFKDMAADYGCALDTSGAEKAGMGTTAEDVDNDGDLDLIVCNLANQTDSYFRNEGGKYFLDRTAASKLAGSDSKQFTRFGVGLVDFDNDGNLDMYQANGRVANGRNITAGGPASEVDAYAESNMLFRGLADGTFEELKPRGGTSEDILATTRAAVFGDIDNDGGVDILLVNKDAPPTLLHNQVKGRGNWVMFSVLDRFGKAALGASVTMQAGDTTRRREVRSGYSYLAASDPRVHVGLGSLKDVRQVQVTWIDGSRELFGDFPAGALHVLRQGEGTAP